MKDTAVARVEALNAMDIAPKNKMIGAGMKGKDKVKFESIKQALPQRYAVLQNVLMN